jgi:hypothetical protein
MENRYNTIKALAVVLKVFAYIFLVLGVVAFITLFAGSSMFEEFSYGKGAIGGIITLVLSILMFVLLYYLSEFTYIILSIEENARNLVEQIKPKA